MPTSSSLDLICDQITRLKGVGHPSRAHADTVADADSSELVANELGVAQRFLNRPTKVQEMAVTAAKRMGMQPRLRLTEIARTGCLRTYGRNVSHEQRKRTLRGCAPYARHTYHSFVEITIVLDAICGI
jgi:hypothetical protein